MARVSLQHWISSIRTELLDAHKAWTQAADPGLTFDLGPVELEVTVSTEATAEAGGGLKFWVVSTKAGGSVSSTIGQRLCITLNPRGNFPVGGPGEEDLI